MHAHAASISQDGTMMTQSVSYVGIELLGQLSTILSNTIATAHDTVVKENLN